MAPRHLFSFTTFDLSNFFFAWVEELSRTFWAKEVGSSENNRISPYLACRIPEVSHCHLETCVCWSQQTWWKHIWGRHSLSQRRRRLLSRHQRRAGDVRQGAPVTLKLSKQLAALHLMRKWWTLKGVRQVIMAVHTLENVPLSSMRDVREGESCALEDFYILDVQA